MTARPNYTNLELFRILSEETPIPSGINEYSYETQIKHNRLKWKVNVYLFQSKLRNQLLDESSKKIISLIGYLNWIVVALIVAFSLFANHHLFLLTLVVYPLFTTSGGLDNSVILTLIAVVSVLSFEFTNVYFFSAFIVFILAYLISKLQFELFKKQVYLMAFANFRSFWKFYSNKLVYLDKTGVNNNYKELFERIPDLNI